MEFAYHILGSRKKKVILPNLNGALVNFRTFMENQETHVKEETALKYYKKYREDYFRKQN